MVFNIPLTHQIPGANGGGIYHYHPIQPIHPHTPFFPHGYHPHHPHNPNDHGHHPNDGGVVPPIFPNPQMFHHPLIGSDVGIVF